MVRINLIDPRNLADQHLIAEYNEILMLFGHVRKYPEPRNAPASFKLGEGHIEFFKGKLAYLKKRHELIKREMRRRGFRPAKTIILSEFPNSLAKDWKPTSNDKQLIKARLVSRIRANPVFYRYCGSKKSQAFFIEKIKRG